MKHLLALPILFYRLLLSPIIGPRCRHQPTCSEYALIALRRHGAWAGFWLGLSRIARCHPWGSSGYDPPPEHVGRHGLKFWRHGDWSWGERPLKRGDDTEQSQAEDHS